MADNVELVAHEILKRVQEDIAESRERTDAQIEALRRDMVKNFEELCGPRHAEPPWYQGLRGLAASA